MKQRNFFNANITRLVARALEQYLKSFPLAASLRLIFIFIYFVSGRFAFIAYHSTDLHFSFGLETVEIFFILPSLSLSRCLQTIVISLQSPFRQKE